MIYIYINKKTIFYITRYISEISLHYDFRGERKEKYILIEQLKLRVVNKRTQENHLVF